jgi:predicted dehydrogenase
MAPARVGFIGAGSVLWAYLQVLDRLVPRGLALEGPICARDRETWPSILARRPGAHLVADAREAVEGADVVVVITPPGSHAELARLALERGRHIVVEKPLALDRAEAEVLAELAAESGLLALAAPFVQLAPTLRVLYTLVVGDRAIGDVHSARGLYGNAGSTWSAWYHEAGVGALPEVGIYNLKSLTALLGPVAQVFAAEATAIPAREIGELTIGDPDPDVVHVVLRHESGAISSVVASQAIQRYRRTALELYGTEGTANLLGDDWDPRGLEVWRNATGAWEEREAIDATWLWADGLREAVVSLREERPPLADLAHDLHLLDVIEAARRSVSDGAWARVDSRFAPLDLTFRPPANVEHIHDHTRPLDEQT